MAGGANHATVWRPTTATPPPAMGALGNRFTRINTPVTVPIALSDGATAPAGLILSASSSNSALVPGAISCFPGLGPTVDHHSHPRHHDYRVRERRIPTCCGEIVYPARRHRCLRRHGWRLQDGRHDLSAEQRCVVSPQVEHGIWLFTQWVGPWASPKDPCGRSGNHRSLLWRACPIASPHRAIASQLPAHT